MKQTTTIASQSPRSIPNLADLGLLLVFTLDILHTGYRPTEEKSN